MINTAEKIWMIHGVRDMDGNPPRFNHEHNEFSHGVMCANYTLTLGALLAVMFMFPSLETH